MKRRLMQNEVELLLRVRQALTSFSSSDNGRAGWRLFVLLIACMLMISGLNVLNSYIGRDFISSVESRDMPRFVFASVVYLIVFGVSTLVAVLYRYVEERLALLWRDWQTRSLLQRYLEGRTYLKLSAEGGVENPDQRIADDVRVFATMSLSIVLRTVNAIITALAFSGVLWSISPLLFGGAVAYGLVGTAVTIFIGRRLVSLNTVQTDHEAVFRAELIRVRENAETIALVQNETGIRKRLEGMFLSVTANARRIIAVNRNVSFFTTGFNYLIPVIPVLVVAHLFMRGEIEFGVVTQSAVAFGHLMGALSLIVTQFQSMSSYAAVLNRIRALDEALETASHPAGGGTLELREQPGSVRYEHVTLTSPEGKPLVTGLDMTVDRGARVLVRTANYRASRALFRTTAGLTGLGSGRITRPDETRILFLPERPHLPNTLTFRELLHIDTPDAERTAAAVLAELRLSQVPGMVGGWDAAWDWAEVLSLEEQAMLVAARAVLAAPDFVYFDHPFSIIAPTEFARVFAALEARGIGYVCLGRAGEEPLFFDTVLNIRSDGSWTLDEVSGLTCLPLTSSAADSR